MDSVKKECQKGGIREVENEYGKVCLLGKWMIDSLLQKLMVFIKY